MVLKINAALILTVAAAVAACSTAPSPSADGMAPIPSERLHLQALSTPTERNASKALVIVERDHGFMLGACMFDVFYDGTRMAKVAPGERALFELPPGRYQFHMEYGGIICPAFASPSYLVDLGAGERATVRMGARTMLGFIQVRKDGEQK
jgi:hypothetical protein